MPIDAAGTFDGVASFALHDTGNSKVLWKGTLAGDSVTITGAATRSPSIR